MPLTLISNPENVHFARNPAVVKLRADQDGFGTLYDAVGVRAELEHLDTDRFQTNDTLTVEFEEPDGTTTTVVFTAKAVYDDDNEIPDDSFAGTDTEYWVAVKDIVGAHPKIAPFFSVYISSSGGEKLNIQALNPTGWTLTVTNDAGFTVTDVAAVADATPDNYRVMLEVYVERTYRGGDFTLAAQLDGVHESGTGYVYFDLSSVLAAECRAARQEPLVPVWGTDAPFLADNFRRYYFRYTEEYGSPAVAQDWTHGQTKLALDAGVSQATFAAGDFLAGLDDTDSLLTWMPEGRRIGPAQPEYVAWYNHTGATRTVYLRVVWYDVTDNSAGGDDYFYEPGLSVRAGEVAVFPVSPELFALDAEDNAYRFTVQVYYTAITPDELSQTRSYHIDRDYYGSVRYLQYLNGFGTPETVRCTGDFGKKLKVDRQVAERPLLPGYNEQASDTYQHNRTWSNDLVYRTGFLTAAEADTMQEMLIAGEVYDVSADGYLPLLIDTNSFSVSETRGTLRSYEIVARPRLNYKNYSKKRVNNLLAGAWQEPGGVAWFDDALIEWQTP